MIRFSFTTLACVTSLPLAFAFAAACQPSQPCDAGFVQGEDHNCRAVASPDAGDAGEAGSPASTAEGGATGDGGVEGSVEAAAASSFGKTCASMDECGGDAPVCGAPQFPVCTQILCQDGEANAGVCPAGWTCLATPGNPSVCFRM